MPGDAGKPEHSHRERIPLHRPKYSGSERRHAQRHHLVCLSVIFRRPLLWRLLKSPRSEPCRVSNVTSQGVRFYTKTKLRRGSVIDIEFDVPVGVFRISDQENLRARVIWQKWSKSHDAYRTGAKFIHVSKSVHEDLARMVSDASLYSSRF